MSINLRFNVKVVGGLFSSSSSFLYVCCALGNNKMKNVLTKLTKTAKTYKLQLNRNPACAIRKQEIWSQAPSISIRVSAISRSTWCNIIFLWALAISIKMEASLELTSTGSFLSCRLNFINWKCCVQRIHHSGFFYFAKCLSVYENMRQTCEKKTTLNRLSAADKTKPPSNKCTFAIPCGEIICSLVIISYELFTLGNV